MMNIVIEKPEADVAAKVESQGTSCEDGSRASPWASGNRHKIIVNRLNHTLANVRFGRCNRSKAAGDSDKWPTITALITAAHKGLQAVAVLVMDP